MVYLLDENEISFPDPSLADPDGLLAVGGDLRQERLLLAYQNGIFPWYDQDSPILWYAPLKRFVMYPQKLRISNSLKQSLRSNKFAVTWNTCFRDVIYQCSSVPRKDQEGTWIIPEMIEAYINLHQAGYAHSIEVWKDNKLVGGLYGVLAGKVFCGESMFSKVSNASKIALVNLAKRFNLELIDCQIESDHLKKMGAEFISQKQYLNQLLKFQIEPNAFQKTL